MGSLRNQIEKVAKETIPFHMPGHKRNRELNPLFALDVTEIEGTDDLHHPESVLKEAQIRAAKIFGAKKSFFLVGGSTVGVLTAISAAVPFGGKLLLPRCSHKSVYHAMALRHITPVYLSSQTESFHHYDQGVDVSEIREKINEVDAVLLTSPTYEGILLPVSEVVKIAHEQGKPVLIDSAHGAHLGLHGDFPESVLSQGADVVIHSLHKTLPAPTMTGLLHINSDFLREEEVQYYLSVYQSSSPSYPLMIGIEDCLDYIEQKFPTAVSVFQENRLWLGKQIESLTCIKRLDFYQGDSVDPCKMLLHTEGRLSGTEMVDCLRKYHIEPELTAPTYVLLIMTPCDQRESYEILVKALSEIQEKAFGKEPQTYRLGDITPVIRIPLYEAVESKKQCVSLTEAEGKISGGEISLYPPGQPLVLPGEEITGEILSRLVEYQRLGLNLTGICDDKIFVL